MPKIEPLWLFTIRTLLFLTCLLNAISSVLNILLGHWLSSAEQGLSALLYWGLYVLATLYSIREQAERA